MSQYITPRTIDGGMNGGSVFTQDDDAARIAYMKALGAVNVDPPLPRSSHLRNKKSGLVLPWNEMLAEQRDIMECCDAHGNTDPRAWMPTVDNTEIDEEARQMEILKAQSLVLAQGKKQSSGYEQPHTPVEAQPMDMPYGAIPLDDLSDERQKQMAALMEMVES